MQLKLMKKIILILNDECKILYALCEKFLSLFTEKLYGPHELIWVYSNKVH